MQVSALFQRSRNTNIKYVVIHIGENICIAHVAVYGANQAVKPNDKNRNGFVHFSWERRVLCQLSSSILLNSVQSLSK